MSSKTPKTTLSGIEIPAYLNKTEVQLNPPGEFPFTRGVYPKMYRDRLWTMRMYSGFGTASESNQRYKKLIASGGTGLSVAFDLPTQMGLDSDDSKAQGEVGKSGVAIDSVEDMLELFSGIDLSKVSTSMTINSTAAILLTMYQVVAEEQGVDAKVLRGTIQNDLLKEYAARGTYIYPVKHSMRLITNLFEYCHQTSPKWNTISISGYHIREAGSTAVQEVAFTLSNGLAYVQAAVEAGLKVDEFAPRLSFFFNSHNNFFEEICKFRAARTLWAKLLKERFQANDRSCQLRFHTQTGGSTLTAQQIENNVVRVAYQAMSAVLGGTQSLHTNGKDEALSLPTESSATTALRTQQILANETGVIDTVDPLAGSYFVEELTQQIEENALKEIYKIDEMGGAVAAIEQGYMQDQIQKSAYDYQKKIENKELKIVGVNCFEESAPQKMDLHKVDESIAKTQSQRLADLKSKRDNDLVQKNLLELKKAASTEANLIPLIKSCVQARATLGEVSNVLREVFGEFMG